MAKPSSKVKRVRFAQVDEWRKSWSLLVPIISMVHVTLFIITMFVNNCPQHSDGCILRSLGRFSFQPLRENPLLGPSVSTLSRMGGLSWYLAAQHHQFWRIFTSTWLHVGLIHLFMNTVCLLFVGIRIEQRFGCGRLGSIYFLSGIGGSLFAELFLQHQISAGASIPLFGLLGALLSELIVNCSIYESKLAPLITFILLCMGNLAIGIFPHNDNFSHFWGFVFGFLLGVVFLMRPQHDWGDEIIPTSGGSPDVVSKYKLYQIILWVAAVILLTLGFILGFILVSRGVDGSAHCSWCHYLTCVPTPWWDCNSLSQVSRRPTCNYVISGKYLFMRCENNQRTQLYNGIFSIPSLTVLCKKLCN